MAQDSPSLLSGRGWGNVLYIYHSQSGGEFGKCHRRVWGGIGGRLMWGRARV